MHKKFFFQRGARAPQPTSTPALHQLAPSPTSNPITLNTMHKSDKCKLKTEDIHIHKYVNEDCKKSQAQKEEEEEDKQ